MKNRSYANRGENLEDCIIYSIDKYENRKEAVITKIPTKFIPLRNSSGRVVGCKVEEKSTVDFIGRYKNIPVAFEAKNSNTNRISLSMVKPHQERFLDMWEEQPGAAAFVIVAFNQLQDFYRVPWLYWKTALDLWRTVRGAKKYVKIGDLEPWPTPGKAGLSPEELPDEWRIDSRNIYRLPFLEKLEEYCIQKTSTDILGYIDRRKTEK